MPGAGLVDDCAAKSVGKSRTVRRGGIDLSFLCAKEIEGGRLTTWMQVSDDGWEGCVWFPGSLSSVWWSGFGT